jgi:hypothetical protein
MPERKPDSVARLRRTGLARLGAAEIVAVAMAAGCSSQADSPGPGLPVAQAEEGTATVRCCWGNS